MTRADFERKAREQILKAVIAMRRKSSVYAFELTHLKIVVDWDQPSGWTDGVSLGFNPEWLCSLTLGQTRTFLAHEVEHVEQGLPWRMARYTEDWYQFLNEGADYGINARLVAAGYEPIPNWLLDEQYAGRSTEEIAAELYQKRDGENTPTDGEPSADPSEDDSTSEDTTEGPQQPQTCGDEDSEGGESGDEGAGGADGDDSGAEGDSTGPETNSAGGEGDESGAEGDASNDGGNDADSESNNAGQSSTKPGRGNGATGGVRPYPIDEDDERSAEQQLRDGYQNMRETMTNGVRYAEGNGGLTDAERIWYQDILDPEVSYADILRDLVDEIFPDDYSYDHPDRDYLLRGFYLPSLHVEKPRLVVFAVDTSGSMDRDAFAQASGDVRSICDDLNATLHVVYCDNRVRGEQTLEAGQYEELVPVGGGGTNFLPVFEHIQTLDVEPSVVIYFTDMMCQRHKFPQTEPDVPTYFVRWGAFDHPDLPDWVKVLNMEGGNR